MENELSIVRLVMNASIPVQVVMGLLLLASLAVLDHHLPQARAAVEGT